MTSGEQPWVEYGEREIRVLEGADGARWQLRVPIDGSWYGYIPLPFGEQPTYEYQIISPKGSASGPCSLNLARRMVQQNPGTTIERRIVGPWEKVEQ